MQSNIHETLYTFNFAFMNIDEIQTVGERYFIFIAHHNSSPLANIWIKVIWLLQRDQFQLEPVVGMTLGIQSKQV